MKDSTRSPNWLTPRIFNHYAIMVVLFLTAWLPRVIYSVSRPDQWYQRAIKFWDAILSQDWSATYQQYHPGVTTMWLAGGGIKLAGWRLGLSSAQLSTYEYDATLAGVIPLATVVAFCIVLIYVVLAQLLDRRTAAAAGFLIGLNSFHITQSKVLHVDALLATFMLVSIAFLLLNAQRKTASSLIASGLFAGLSFLTKSPSWLLIPFAAFVIAGSNLPWMNDKLDWSQSSRKKWHALGWSMVRRYLIWFAVVATVFLLLWPAMWVEPVGVLKKIVENTLLEGGRTHPNPTFFNGISAVQDPGFPYYITTILWRTSLVSLPLAVLGLFVALFDIKRRRLRYRQSLWWLILYMILFLIQMSLSAKKGQRYLLPFFLALDVLAGVGLVWIVGQAPRLLRQSLPHRAGIAIIVLILVGQAILVLSHHPYYGTHFNRLMGGARTAQHILDMQDQTEGLDLAAQYLNTLPGAEGNKVTIPAAAQFLERGYDGQTTVNKEEPDSEAVFRIYLLNLVMRENMGEKWQQTWQKDRQREPIWTQEFEGISYVWIYEN